MNDLSLLNELELKIREMVTLEREKARNAVKKDALKEASRLSEIEEKLKILFF